MLTASRPPLACDLLAGSPVEGVPAAGGLVVQDLLSRVVGGGAVHGNLRVLGRAVNDISRKFSH